MQKLHTCRQSQGIALDEYVALPERTLLLAYVSVKFHICATLQLASCVQFAPPRGHFSRHSSLKQDCMQASASQVSSLPEFWQQLVAVLAHVRLLQFPL